jgi:4-hydroxy-2-oxoheptanedioate aldolase
LLRSAASASVAQFRQLNGEVKDAEHAVRGGY